MEKRNIVDVINEVKPLIAEIRDIKEMYIGKVFIEKDWEIIDVIKSYEDGGDTDLYSCVIYDKGGNWIKYYVEVNPLTSFIVSVDDTSVDIGYDGELYDCVLIDNVELLNKTVIPTEKGNFKMNVSPFNNGRFTLSQKLTDVQDIVLGLTKEEIYDLYFVVSDFMIKNL